MHHFCGTYTLSYKQKGLVLAMWMDKLRRGVLQVSTETGTHYITPSLRERMRLLWIFRNFRILPLHVLSAQQQRLINTLCRGQHPAPRGRAESSCIIGIIESFPKNANREGGRPRTFPLRARRTAQPKVISVPNPAPQPAAEPAPVQKTENEAQHFPKASESQVAMIASPNALAAKPEVALLPETASNGDATGSKAASPSKPRPAMAEALAAPSGALPHSPVPDPNSA